MPSPARRLRHHLARTVAVTAPPDAVFAHLDDQTRLAEHMQKPSAMMGGGQMTYAFDAGRGQAVGSHIRMGGSAFGVSLSVDEVVTERVPPSRKAWQTAGPVRLLIIGGYAMGFDIVPSGQGCRLTVWINYDLPPGPLGWLALPLAALYGRWCIARMAGDAVSHFAT
ncbi:SRPBCC family protein [Oleomonas cavernae]|uniref:SRPBCC family protein n=1 Tax=Oleomonas cavernae TaxID=2320859 RepID=A0A418VUF4_9PROT|nr:SRPBCC family protein [Oleomonas cavernae]RJF80775.1 SRPBCC family protein [Oleomonas cavernae]